MSIPIITIDGPSGTGKGTLSHLLAQHLAWHYLDSGALYRVLAYAAHKNEISLTDEARLAEAAKHLNVVFDSGDKKSIFLENEEVSQKIRTEVMSQITSKIASLPKVRAALLARQRAFQQFPGLVTDGRDMGTVVFPEATVKIFMTASAEERAHRRYSQLQRQGMAADWNEILSDLKQRDERDSQRSVAPLKPAIDAVIVDTTGLTIEEVFKQLLLLCKKAGIKE